MNYRIKTTIRTNLLKPVKHLLPLLLIVFTATSCLDDDGYSLDKFWIDYGVVKGSNNSFTIVTDNGKVLFPSATAVSLAGIKDSMRLMVNYTILGDAGTQGIDYYVKINGLRKVLKKDIFMLSEATADSIGNDGARVDNLWLTPAYDLLNIEFSYEGSPYYTHRINLAIDPENAEDENGNVILQLRHHKNGDPYTSPLLSSVASFDLRSIRREGVNKVGFVLKSKNLDGSVYEKTGIYEYDDKK